MVNILTDSTADIPIALSKKYKIKTIPMYVQIDGKLYKDGEDIDAQQLFNQVERTGIYPTTSAPSPADFIRFFDNNKPAIYIGVSSRLSATFRNAQLALSELGDNTITLIDSLSFSTGYGQVVLQAAEWRDEGIAYEEICHRIRELISRTRGIFILDMLDYLYHGGRCSAIQCFVSSVLKIHPFLNIRPDGTLGILQKVRGSRNRAIKVLLNHFKDELDNFSVKRIFLTHLNCDAEVRYVIDEINALFMPIEIVTAEVGCVLATHSGPKPLGIAYILD